MDTQSYLPVQPGVGMEENFLSLDDILLSQERLPARTECAFPRLGFLEKSTDNPDIVEVRKDILWKENGQFPTDVMVLKHVMYRSYLFGWRSEAKPDPMQYFTPSFSCVVSIVEMYELQH